MNWQFTEGVVCTHTPHIGDKQIKIKKCCFASMLLKTGKSDIFQCWQEYKKIEICMCYFWECKLIHNFIKSLI